MTTPNTVKERKPGFSIAHLMMTKLIRPWRWALSAGAAVAAFTAHAQIDPEPRSFVHFGFNQPLKDDGPQAAYAFYYLNMPQVPATNMTLRLAIAPLYVDGELGFKGLLGENTDLGVGLFGGGFANNYEEVRRGNYFRDESFDGHGGGASVSIYHLFNPTATVPLNGLLRGAVNYHAFARNGDTDDHFKLPESQPFVTLRTGLRWGGKEPILEPRLSMEVSAWYELEYRPDDGEYGFNKDRELKSVSHRFLGRAQLLYTVPHLEHYIAVGLAGGTVIDVDRFSAHRIGGALPFTSEFPLYLPGYFYQELSAQSFGLLYGLYSIPIDRPKRWSVFAGGATALVDYVDGLGQDRHSNSGVTGGIAFTSKNRRVKVAAASSYGIDAIRSDGRGGWSMALLFYWNLGRETSFASDRAFEDLQNARTPFRFGQ
jgi:hypothetical protein